MNKNRFVENSLAHPGGLPSCLAALCFWHEKAEGPAGHSFLSPGPRTLTLWYRILGHRGGEQAGLQQRSQRPSTRPGGAEEGSAGLRSPGLGGRVESLVTAVPRRWGARKGRRSHPLVGWSVCPSWAAGGEVIRQLWLQPHRLCRPPPHPSIRQRLSGPFGGARQMAGPHAWGQRQRSEGLPGWPKHSSHIPQRSLEGNWCLTSHGRDYAGPLGHCLQPGQGSYQNRPLKLPLQPTTLANTSRKSGQMKRGKGRRIDGVASQKMPPFAQT